MDLFDLHCDTITLCSSKNLELRHNDLHISLERLPEGSRWGQAFAIFVPDQLRGEDAVKFFRDNVQFFREQVERTPTALYRLPIMRRSARHLMPRNLLRSSP